MRAKDTVLCTKCRRLQARVDALEAELAALKQVVAQLGQQLAAARKGPSKGYSALSMCSDTLSRWDASRGREPQRCRSRSSTSASAPPAFIKRNIPIDSFTIG